MMMTLRNTLLEKRRLAEFGRTKKTFANPRPYLHQLLTTVIRFAVTLDRLQVRQTSHRDYSPELYGRRQKDVGTQFRLAHTTRLDARPQLRRNGSLWIGVNRNAQFRTAAVNDESKVVAEISTIC